MKRKNEIAQNVDSSPTKRTLGFSKRIHVQGPQKANQPTSTCKGGCTPASTGTKDLLTALVHYRHTGDPKIATSIFQQYWHLVVGSCYKLLRDSDASQDAAMDIFQRVLDRLRQETPSYFPGWLFSVTRNHCLELMRKQHRLPQFEQVDEARLLVEENHQFAEEESRMVAMEVHRALKELPDNQRICLEMFYFQELTYKEICEESGFSMMMVKSYIQNGKRRLGIQLGGMRGRMFRDSDVV